MRRTLAILASFGLATFVRADFIDHFNGTALAPNWQAIGPASNYNVGGGSLNVVMLTSPSDPHVNNVNWVDFQTGIDPIVGDFDATARVAWEGPGAGGIRRFALILGGTGARIELEVDPFASTVSGSWGTSTAVISGPPPGEFHELTISRRGSTAMFLVDGLAFASLPGVPTHAISGFRLYFERPYPGPEMRPIRIDLVHVVPSPSAALTLLLGWAHLRRRR